MPRLTSDDDICRVLTHAEAVAVVGHSGKPERPSYQVAQFLRGIGYTVYAVNPRLPQVDGRPVYDSLRSLPRSVDIVVVFRHSTYLPEIVRDAIAIQAPTLWTQLGVSHISAEQQAINAGMDVVINACIKDEYQRLLQQ